MYATHFYCLLGSKNSNRAVIKNRIQNKMRSGERLGRSRYVWAFLSFCLCQGLAVPAPNAFKSLCRPLPLIKSNIFLALWKMSHVEISQFKMSPQTCVLCQSTRLRSPTAPLNVLNVMSMTGLQRWGTEILLLWMDFTLKKLTRPHSSFNVRIYENASPLLNLCQDWFSNFENHVQLSIYLKGRVFVNPRRKLIMSRYHN